VEERGGVRVRVRFRFRYSAAPSGERYSLRRRREAETTIAHQEVKPYTCPPHPFPPCSPCPTYRCAAQPTVALPNLPLHCPTYHCTAQNNVALPNLPLHCPTYRCTAIVVTSNHVSRFQIKDDNQELKNMKTCRAERGELKADSRRVPTAREEARGEAYFWLSAFSSLTSALASATSCFGR
jgi:hypothetical protein